MKPIVPLAAFLGLQLGSAAVRPPSLHGQTHEQVVWRQAHVSRCAKADTLFGRQWRSNARLIRVGYDQKGDTTAIGTMVRTGSWETTSSRLVGTEAVIRVPGREVKADSARIEWTLRFLDTLYRSPAQAHIKLQVDGSPMELEEPQVDYPEGVPARGVPVVVTVLLTPSQSFALAHAGEVKGTMGPYDFDLFRWELWDLNAIYRATVCGID